MHRLHRAFHRARALRQCLRHKGSNPRSVLTCDGTICTPRCTPLPRTSATAVRRRAIAGSPRAEAARANQRPANEPAPTTAACADLPHRLHHACLTCHAPSVPFNSAADRSRPCPTIGLPSVIAAASDLSVRHHSPAPSSTNTVGRPRTPEHRRHHALRYCTQRAACRHHHHLALYSLPELRILEEHEV